MEDSVVLIEEALHGRVRVSWQMRGQRCTPRDSSAAAPCAPGPPAIGSPRLVRTYLQFEFEFKQPFQCVANHRGCPGSGDTPTGPPSSHTGAILEPPKCRVPGPTTRHSSSWWDLGRCRNLNKIYHPRDPSQVFSQATH